MAVDTETLYSVAHGARRLEAAALALSLTNNPAPALETAYDAEATTLGGLIGGGGLDPSQAIVAGGDSITVRDGSQFDLPVVPGLHIVNVLDSTVLGVTLDADVLPVVVGTVLAYQNADTTKGGVGAVVQGEGELVLELDPLDAIVSNGSQMAIPVTGTYTSLVECTVVNGLITAIVLS